MKLSPHKKSGPKAVKIAAKVLAGGKASAAEIATLAASVLAQQERPASKRPTRKAAPKKPRKAAAKRKA